MGVLNTLQEESKTDNSNDTSDTVRHDPHPNTERMNTQEYDHIGR